MRLYRAEKIDQLELRAGRTIELESLRQAVVPPYYMLMPFIEVPPGIEVESQRGLEEDGVHGAIYCLKAVEAGEGELVIGFNDMMTGQVTHQKTIPVKVT